MATKQSTKRTYRSKHEITAGILGLLAVGPLSKTRVMYMSFLSYDQLGNYIQLLRENKLAEMKKDKKMHITEDGKKWLETYKAVPPVNKKGA